MNTKQKLVLALGAILLILNFVFPYASYPTKEFLEDGRMFRSTVRWAFVPIWNIREENDKAVIQGNMFDVIIIQWPAVLALAAGIVIVTGWYIYRFAGEPPSRYESSSQVNQPGESLDAPDERGRR